MKRRCTSPSKAESAAKRQETNELNDSLRIVSKVLEAQEYLPPMARAMLTDMLRDSLGVPHEERHSFQTRAVEMVAGVFAKMETDIKDQTSVEEAKASGANAVHEEREKAVADAEQILEEKLNATSESKTRLADSARNFKAARAALAAVAANAKCGDEEWQAAATKKNMLDTLLSDSIQPLCAGELSEVEVRDKTSTLVTLLGGKFDFEDSILRALPIAFAQAPSTRGQFDTVVVAQLMEGVAKRLKDLEELLANEETAKSERQRTVDEAEAPFVAAKEKQKECAKAFTVCRDAQEESEAGVNDARRRLKDLGPEMKKVRRNIEQLQKSLRRFQEGPLDTFSKLQNRTMIKPTPEVEGGSEQAEAASPSVANAVEPPLASPSPAKAADSAIVAAPSPAGMLAAGA